MTPFAESNTGGSERFKWLLPMVVVFILGATIYLGFKEDRWGPLIWSVGGMAAGWSIVTITWELVRRTYERD